MSATERSDQAYAQWLEGARKLDYFVLGVSIALIGYLGPRQSAATLGANPSTVELAALVALLLAAFCGLKQAAAHVDVLRHMQRRLWLEETSGALAHVAAQGAPHLNEATGEVLSPEMAEARLQTATAERNRVRADQDKAIEKTDWWTKARNGLLMIGLTLVVAARALAALQAA